LTASAPRGGDRWAAAFSEMLATWLPNEEVVEATRGWRPSQRARRVPKRRPWPRPLPT